uniref:Odorant binding protein 5 n=1 Tax=Xylotrechus quadripes TaxID=554073 RepID=A0A346HGM7_9CUCU|nr:odorant binding protein 5 [Xylotrechus quadripes]
MKFFVALVASISVVLVAEAGLTDEQKQKLIAYHKECGAQSGVDKELIAKARKGDFSDDPKLKEHLFCVAKKIGSFNEAGEIQQQVLKPKITAALGDEALAQKLLDECAVKKDTPQDTVYAAVKCYYEKSPTHISVV